MITCCVITIADFLSLSLYLSLSLSLSLTLSLSRSITITTWKPSKYYYTFNFSSTNTTTTTTSLLQPYCLHTLDILRSKLGNIIFFSLLSISEKNFTLKKRFTYKQKKTKKEDWTGQDHKKSCPTLSFLQHAHAHANTYALPLQPTVNKKYASFLLNTCIFERTPLFFFKHRTHFCNLPFRAHKRACAEDGKKSLSQLSFWRLNCRSPRQHFLKINDSHFFSSFKKSELSHKTLHIDLSFLYQRNPHNFNIHHQWKSDIVNCNFLKGAFKNPSSSINWLNFVAKHKCSSTHTKRTTFRKKSPNFEQNNSCSLFVHT